MTEPTQLPTDAAGVVELLIGPGTPPTDEALARAAELVDLRIKAHRKGYHADAILGGLIVKDLRERVPPWTWREIDQLTGYEATTARRWLESAERYLTDPTFTNRPVEDWSGRDIKGGTS
jgi:hypothetical protein